MGLISTGRRLSRLQPSQPFKGGVQGLVLLGKAEADEVLVAAVAVEGRQRDGGHADASGEPLAEGGLGGGVRRMSGALSVSGMMRRAAAVAAVRDHRSG